MSHIRLVVFYIQLFVTSILDHLSKRRIEFEAFFNVQNLLRIISDEIDFIEYRSVSTNESYGFLIKFLSQNFSLLQVFRHLAVAAKIVPIGGIVLWVGNGFADQFQLL